MEAARARPARRPASLRREGWPKGVPRFPFFGWFRHRLFRTLLDELTPGGLTDTEPCDRDRTRAMHSSYGRKNAFFVFWERTSQAMA